MPRRENEGCEETKVICTYELSWALKIKAGSIFSLRAHILRYAIEMPLAFLHSETHVVFILLPHTALFAVHAFIS